MRQKGNLALIKNIKIRAHPSRIFMCIFRPDPIYPTPTPDKTAAKCRKDVCQLPDCSCGGKEIPGKKSYITCILN